MKNQFITEVNRFQELAGIITESKKELKEEETALDPEVQALVSKLIPQIDESKKTEMNENVAEYSELIAQILAGTFGAAATIGFGNLVALAIKKGGNEEFRKAMNQLRDAHKGSDGVPRFNK
jgi:hypothetical protein